MIIVDEQNRYSEIDELNNILLSNTTLKYPNCSEIQKEESQGKHYLIIFGK